jgi:hypothetical protein
MQKMNHKKVEELLSFVLGVSQNPSKKDISDCLIALDTIAEHGTPCDAFTIIGMLSKRDQGDRELVQKMVQTIGALMMHKKTHALWPSLQKKYEELIEGDLCDCGPICECCCPHSGRKPMDTFLTIENISKFHTQFFAHESAHLLGIATFDPNSYIREIALQAMEYVQNFYILPYVLLRLDDSAPRVRARAHEMVRKIFTQPPHQGLLSIEESLERSLLTGESLRIILWCRPLIKRLSTIAEFDLKLVQEIIFTYVRNLNYQKAILRVFEYGNWQDQQFLATILFPQITEHPEIIDLILRSHAPEIRVWALRHDLNVKGKKEQHLFFPHNHLYEDRIALLAQDKASRVRYYALSHIEACVPKVEQDSYRHFFEDALFDDNQRIRELAQSFMKDYPFLNEYMRYVERLKLKLGRSMTPGILKGIGEIVKIKKDFFNGPQDKDDVAGLLHLIRDYLNEDYARHYVPEDQIASIKAAALYAAHVNSMIDADIVNGLLDSRAKIRTMCVQILSSGKYGDLLPEIAKILTQRGDNPVAQCGALSIVVHTTGFEQILYILQTLTQKDADLKKRAWQYFEAWSHKFSQYSYSVTPNMHAINEMSIVLQKLYVNNLTTVPDGDTYSQAAWSTLPYTINEMRREAGLEEVSFEYKKNPSFYLLTVKNIVASATITCSQYSFVAGCGSCGAGVSMFSNCKVIGLDSQQRGILQTNNGCLLVDANLVYALQSIGFNEMEKVRDGDDNLLPYKQLCLRTSLPPFSNDTTGYEIKDQCTHCVRDGRFVIPGKELHLVYKYVKPDILTHHILKTHEHFGSGKIVLNPITGAIDIYQSFFPQPLFIISEHVVRILQEYGDKEQWYVTPIEMSARDV